MLAIPNVNVTAKPQFNNSVMSDKCQDTSEDAMDMIHAETKDI